jgi:CheY-like chemotaxis protein
METAMEPCAEADGEPKHLLVVDDEPLVCEMLVRTLSRRGLHSFAAHDGLEALRVIEQHHEQIGAVLSDVRMPRVDGIRLARVLAETHPDLPVALMSSELDPLELEDLCNVKQWLVKPFDTEVLVAKVAELLEC